MADKQYIYSVARIRSKELALFNKAVLDQLLACKTYDECLQLLADKGWSYSGEETAEELLAIERQKTWDLMSELVEDMTVFHTFLYENDFHNLKAAIRAVYVNKEVPHIYIAHGTILPEVFYKAVKEQDFSLLPEYMRVCAKEAYEIQFHTGDSQLCDVIIDKRALECIYEKAKTSGNELFETYAELKIAAANINIAIRSYKTGKTKAFLERALVKCDSLDIKKLIEVIPQGEEAIYAYLATTTYEDAISIIKDSPALFDKWCDDLIIKHIKGQQANPFTISPLAAYILARENEIKSVRILLSGKLNNLPEESIRERLREMYV